MVEERAGLSIIAGLGRTPCPMLRMIALAKQRLSSRPASPSLHGPSCGRPRLALAVEVHAVALATVATPVLGRPRRSDCAFRPARRVGSPSGQPAMARICCSNCEVEAPSSVQWPELWTRGAISLTSASARSRGDQNISTASTPT